MYYFIFAYQNQAHREPRFLVFDYLCMKIMMESKVMELTFLGTGTSQGVPMIACQCAVCSSCDVHDHRLRSSVLVRKGDTTLVVDTGMDFRYQMLRAGVERLDGVLYTHGHKDHTGGMDDLRAFNHATGEAVNLYCDERVRGLLLKDFDYAFDRDNVYGVPQVRVHLIDKESFDVGELRITPVLGLHHRLEVRGFMFDDRLCYLTDMNFISDQEIDKIRGVDTLIINALRIESHVSHFTLAQALEVIERIAPRRALLTHISHQLGLYAELNPQLPAGVEMAYDNLTITV